MAIHDLPLRSISLPCRLHSNYLQFEQDLKSFQPLSFSSISSCESLQIALTSLAESFISIQQLKHSSHIQQNRNCVDQLLDQSVSLIDICSLIRDMLLTMQEHVQGLQSALRRRGKDSSISSDIQAYLSYRKKQKKTIAKSLRTLKQYESSTTKSHEFSSSLIEGTKEAHDVAADIFRSLLTLINSNSNSNSKWSTISKLILRPGFIDKGENHEILNEVERVDVVLCCICKFDVKEVQERLMALCESIKQLETKLDSVSRCLIQNRVSLLNLVTF